MGPTKQAEINTTPLPQHFSLLSNSTIPTPSSPCRLAGDFVLSRHAPFLTTWWSSASDVMDLKQLLALYVFLSFLFRFFLVVNSIFHLFSPPSQTGITPSPTSLIPSSTSSKTPTSSRIFAHRYLHLYHQRTTLHRRLPHQLTTCTSPPLSFFTCHNRRH